MPTPVNIHDQVLLGLGSGTRPLTAGTVPVLSTATDLLLIENPGYYRIFLKNLGATSLATFQILTRNSSQGTWREVVVNSTQFATIPSEVSGFLLASDADVDPTTLATGEEWNGAIDTRSCAYVLLRATVSSGSTQVFLEVR